MTNRERISLETKSTAVKPDNRPKEGHQKENKLTRLLQRLGNRSVQRLVVQRAGSAPYQLDDETAGQINRERGSGAPLDSRLQMQMSDQLGFDMSGVRVHTSNSADQLNQQLNAKAFTTGQDVFFRSGAYDPGSSGGQELIAHELTHVVQQGTGQVQNPGGMTVNAPGDRFEQQADQASKALNSMPASGVQMQAAPEEEEEVQMQDEDEEEVQMQDEGEEEEVQMQEVPEEEELQMNGFEEEEEQA